MLCIHWICLTLHHKATRRTAAENKTLAHGKVVFSIFLRPALSDYVCIKSTWGLSWELSRQAFPKRSWQWKSCVRILWGLFCRCSSPSSMRWFQTTSSLWIHHNMWPSLSWEVKNTDLLSLRRERARRTVKAEPDQHRGDLTPLSYIWVKRRTEILRYNSISLRLCTSDLTTPKTGLHSYAKTIWCGC